MGAAPLLFGHSNTGYLNCNIIKNQKADNAEVVVIRGLFIYLFLKKQLQHLKCNFVCYCVLFCFLTETVHIPGKIF